MHNGEERLAELGFFFEIQEFNFPEHKKLRIVQTQAILFFNQCRKESDPTYNDSKFESAIDFESIWKFIIQFQSRSMSDPPLSDIDFKNKMAWVRTTLNDL